MNVNWDCGKLCFIDDDNCEGFGFVVCVVLVMECKFGTKQSCSLCIAQEILIITVD